LHTIGAGDDMIPRILALVLLGEILLVTPAFAYEDRGTDPREGTSTDVRSSARKVFLTETHGRMLVVSVRLYEHDVAHFSIFRLDSRGDALPDFRIVLDDSGEPCQLFRRGSRERVARCDLRTDVPFVEGPTLYKGRINVRHVRPTKRIRWWVEALGPSDPSDRAPDRGWYPNI